MTLPIRAALPTRGTDREIYSIHPIGISVLLVPVPLAGYDGVLVS